MSILQSIAIASATPKLTRRRLTAYHVLDFAALARILNPARDAGKPFDGRHLSAAIALRPVLRQV